MGKRDDAEVMNVEGFRVTVQLAIQKLMATNRVSRAQLAKVSGIGQVRLHSFFEPECPMTIRELAALFFYLGEDVIVTSKTLDALARRKQAPRRFLLQRTAARDGREERDG